MVFVSIASLKYEEILSKFEYCLIKIDASVKTTC